MVCALYRRAQLEAGYTYRVVEGRRKGSNGIQAGCREARKDSTGGLAEGSNKAEEELYTAEASTAGREKRSDQPEGFPASSCHSPRGARRRSQCRRPQQQLVRQARQQGGTTRLLFCRPTTPPTARHAQQRLHRRSVARRPVWQQRGGGGLRQEGREWAEIALGACLPACLSKNGVQGG